MAAEPAEANLAQDTHSERHVLKLGEKVYALVCPDADHGRTSSVLVVGSAALVGAAAAAVEEEEDLEESRVDRKGW